jgi:hypothetical protein
MDNDSGLPISFSFGLDSVSNESEFFFWGEDISFYSVDDDKKFLNVELKVAIVKTSAGTRISRITLSERENDVTYDVQVADNSQISSLRVNGKEMIRELGASRLMITPASILPTARLISEEVSSTTSPSLPEKWDRHPVKKAVGDLISPFLDKRTKGDSLGSLVQMLFSLSIVNKSTIGDLVARVIQSEG